MTKTAKYKFPQWDPDDKILRTDFNQFAAGVETALTQIIKTHNARIAISHWNGTGGSELSLPYSFIPKMALICGNNQWLLAGSTTNDPLAGSSNALAGQIYFSWRSTDLWVRHRGTGALPCFSDTGKIYYFFAIAPWEI